MKKEKEKEKEKEYRVEWMHNYQWRMDLDQHGTFSSKEKAEKHRDEMQKKYLEMKIRIVEVA